MYKKIIALFAVLFTLTTLAIAQEVDYGVDYFRNGQNEIIRKGVYSNIEGSPLLYDAWLPATVTTTNGKVYENIKLNYNIYEDLITFVYDSADKPLKFQEQVKSFVLYTPNALTFASSYPAVDKQTATSFYQVLSGNAKAALLKKYIKLLNVTKNYNSSETKKFQDFSFYYIYKDGKMQKIGKSKNDVLSALADKKEQLEAFTKQSNINFKKEEDLAKLFDYYLSI